MKKIAIIFGLLTAISVLLFSHTDNVSVKLVVYSSNVSSGDTIFVTGNDSKIGSWTPNVAAFERVNDTTFTLNLLLQTNKQLEYKFTLGDWSKEALNADSTVPQNYLLKLKSDTTLIHKIPLWGEAPRPEIVGQITGEVEYIRDLKTNDKLLPRDIIIWLPPGYAQNKEARYPVLYMHDGQNIFDPATSFLGIDWQLDETADSLIRNDIIEPIIIVGMNSTTHRTTEYSENDTGYAYIDFIKNDLKPIIDKKYRTKSDKENTAIAGSSMGGLISFMIAWEYPEVFSKAACLSPAFKIRSFDFVNNVTSYNGKKEVQFYIDNGTVGLEDSLQTGVDEMLQALKQKGYKEGRELVWFKDEGAVHNESAWAERSWRFLELFFGRDKEK